MPKVSICTLSAREWDFSDLAARLSQQTFQDFEWIIVDSIYDRRKTLAEDLIRYYDITLIHIPSESNFDNYNVMRDITRNRNRAISYASGEVIIFLDDFTVIDNTFIEEHLKVIDYGISCGKMYYQQKSDTLKDISTLSFKEVYDVLNLELDRDSRWELLKYKETVTPVLGREWTYTGNLAIRKEHLLSLNGFDPNLISGGEDSDLGIRAYNLEIDIYFNPKAHSINLDTSKFPIVGVGQHTHPVAVIARHWQEMKEGNWNLDGLGLYGVYKNDSNTELRCKRCDAKYMLNISDYIYEKEKRKEFKVPDIDYSLSYYLKQRGSK